MLDFRKYDDDLLNANKTVGVEKQAQIHVEPERLLWKRRDVAPILIAALHGMLPVVALACYGFVGQEIQAHGQGCDSDQEPRRCQSILGAASDIPNRSCLQYGERDQDYAIMLGLKSRWPPQPCAASQKSLDPFI